MPELAEVEYYRKRWNPGLQQTVEKVHVNPRARIFRDTSAIGIQRKLKGTQFVNSFAHGKRMMFQFSCGHWLGLHLGMTGKLHTAPQEDYKREKHDHLVLDLEDTRLIFTDPRMFGKLSLDITGDETPPAWWQELPPQTTDSEFTKKYFETFLRRFPKTPLKTLLLDQRGFPGIGNWMADEICWQLKIAPDTRSGEIPDSRLPDIWKIIRKVSRDAIRVIGTDWKKPPNSWLFNHRWKNGGHCPNCNDPLYRADLRGRTTCWCPGCQS